MSEEVSCRPIKIWVQEKDQKICRPCVLTILVQWYESELKEHGNDHAGDQLRQLKNKEEITPLEIAEELDNIKGKVKEPELKKRLQEFDCAVQTSEFGF